MNYWYLILLFLGMTLSMFLLYWIFDEVKNFTENSISKNSIFIIAARSISIAAFSYLFIYLYSLFYVTNTVILNIIFPIVLITLFKYGFFEAIIVSGVSYASYVFSFGWDTLNAYSFQIYFALSLIVILFSYLLSSNKERKRNYLISVLFQVIVGIAFTISIYSIDFSLDPELVDEFFSALLTRILSESIFSMFFVFSTILMFSFLKNRHSLFEVSNFSGYSSYNSFIGKEIVNKKLNNEKLDNAYIFVVSESDKNSKHTDFFNIIKLKYPNLVAFEHIRGSYALFIPSKIKDLHNYMNESVVEFVLKSKKAFIPNEKLSYSVYGLHSYSLNELLLLADYNLENNQVDSMNLETHSQRKIINSFFLYQSSQSFNSRLGFSSIKTGLTSFNLNNIEHYVPVYRYKRGLYSLFNYSISENSWENQYIMRKNNLQSISMYLSKRDKNEIGKESIFIIPLTYEMARDPETIREIKDKANKIGMKDNISFGIIYTRNNFNKLSEEIEFILYNNDLPVKDKDISEKFTYVNIS
ncbi:MAG: hypothetical protein HRS57_00150 [Mycoplasmataceae bacterium]|nr:hypothetical protein [Mycoplasmataceae bacterium]